MKINLKLILGILVIVIIVAALSIWLLPGEGTVTGAAVGATTTAGEDCPTGEDFQTISQCKAWKNSGIKAKGLEILTDDSLDKFCDKIFEMYPDC